MPIAYRDRMKAIPGVAEVTATQWFGGIYQDPANFFANFAVEHDTFFAVYPDIELSPEARVGFESERTTSLVGIKLAERFGWEVGDRVTLEGTIFAFDAETTIRGFINGANSENTFCLMGPSGSGKSTLLNLIAGIDRPSSGRIGVLGDDIAVMSESRLAVWRNHNIGFVFQTFNLIPVLTAFENVELPLLLTRLSRSERREHVTTSLTLVGLEDRMSHYPRQLSGGQEQRVAIARAIVTDPTLILADEPTGDLDARSAEAVLAILEKLNREFGKTVIMVTHDPRAAQHATIVRHLDKGVMLPEGEQPS
jgi:putative ABC transport system ATP-binding protein